MINIKRKKTREVKIGNIVIGGNNPIAVQSMTTIKSSDIDNCVKQINDLENVSCEIARVAVLNSEDVDAIKEIKKKISIPLVADIHYRADYAISALENGADKVRVNPGNLGGLDKFREIIRVAKKLNKAIRIGVNSGSLEQDIVKKHGKDFASAMVESALNYVNICEEENFKNVVVSLKATDVFTSVSAYRSFSQKSDIPLHLGITEAGSVNYGTIKSSVGLGAILLDGIGDTIRVSLTGDPVNEIPVAYDILKAVGVRKEAPEVISCPTCGRIQYDMAGLAVELESKVRGVRKPLKIALMGCVVNGPGEAKEADIAIAGSGDGGVLYIKGEKIKTVAEKDIINEILNAIEEY